MYNLSRLFVIGDSISIHYGPYLERFLPPAIHYARKTDSGAENNEKDLDIPVGANGGDSRMVLEYLKKRRCCDPLSVDVLLLNCGLHDIKTNLATGKKSVSLSDYESNLRAIISETSLSRYRVIWVRTTPVFDDVHNRPGVGFHRHAADVSAYNAVADKVMEEAGIPSIDLHAFSNVFLPAGFCDHVHYKNEIRALQGAFLAGAVSEILKSKF